MLKSLISLVLALLVVISSGCFKMVKDPGEPVSVADITKGTADECVESAVSLVSREQYQDYQLAVESMGLGNYGGAAYNMGYRNRDFTDNNGSLGNQEARLYLRNKFKEMGLDVSIQGYYKNVVAELTGTKTPEKIFIIGAHYDHIKGDMPGGDDNASGVAAVLEAARVLSQYKFESTIRFIGFNAEEDGLLGSTDYIDSLSSDTDVVGMVNIDVILRPGSNVDPEAPIDVDIRTDGAPEWARSYVQAMTDYVPSLKLGGVFDEADSWSDNDAFQSQGINSISLMENSFNDWSSTFAANPYVHGREDASDRLANNPKNPDGVKYDYAFAADVTRAVVALIAKQAVIIRKPEGK